MCKDDFDTGIYTTEDDNSTFKVDTEDDSDTNVFSVKEDILNIIIDSTYIQSFSRQ